MMNRMDLFDNEELCTLLMAQQQVCLSHSCSRLGLWRLSSQWLGKALENVNELGLSDLKVKAELVQYFFSVFPRDNEAERQKPLDLFSLYQDDRLTTFFEGYGDRPRLLTNLALVALRKGFLMSATVLFQKGTRTPPVYFDELLYAIDARIWILVNEGNMDGAVCEMRLRLDVISKWMGNTCVGLAYDYHRLGCLYSCMSHHEECVKSLHESLHLGAAHNDQHDYDALSSIKLLAATLDVMHGPEKPSEAIHHYERALSIEEGLNSKARLINALSNLLIKVSSIDHLEQAINYLTQSLKVQMDDVNNEWKEDVLFETMILLGNAESSKKNSPKAIDWYTLALNTNPDKCASHPTNFLARYNEGATLLRNGDLAGAAHAFEIILNEAVDENPTAPPRGTAALLNAVGNAYFANKNFVAAVERFTQSLSLRNESLSPRQSAATLCNIASAYYRMQKYKESEDTLNEALTVSASLDEKSSYLKGIIMCKLAYIVFRRKSYLDAYNLFSEGVTG